MKVFISWSGDASRKIAAELFEWLPMVVQSIQPYMSAESIEKGTRWATSISEELEGTSVGIVVLTPDNITAPWINFEAGALAKVVDDAKLAPILFGLKPSDVGTPLSQFQVTVFNKSDILKLLKSINACGADDALPESRLEKMHDALWDDLTGKIDPILEALVGAAPAGPKKPESEISQVLEEILVLARQQASSILNPEKLITPDIVRMIVDIASSNIQPQDERMRTISRVLYTRWRDFAELFIISTAQVNDPELAASIKTASARLERVISDLLEHTERTDSRDPRRALSRDEHGRVFRRMPDGKRIFLEPDRETKTE